MPSSQGAAGAECYAVAIDRPGLAAVAFRAGDVIRVLVANLTASEIALVAQDGLRAIGLLDKTAAWSTPPAGPMLLGPYRTMLLFPRADSKRAGDQRLGQLTARSLPLGWPLPKARLTGNPLPSPLGQRCSGFRIRCCRVPEATNRGLEERECQHRLSEDRTVT